MLHARFVFHPSHVTSGPADQGVFWDVSDSLGYLSRADGSGRNPLYRLAGEERQPRFGLTLHLPLNIPLVQGRSN